MVPCPSLSLSAGCCWGGAWPCMRWLPSVGGETERLVLGRQHVVVRGWVLVLGQT